MVKILCLFELLCMYYVHYVCIKSAVNSSLLTVKHFLFFKGPSLSFHVTSCVVHVMCPLQLIGAITVKMILQQSHLTETLLTFEPQNCYISLKP